MVRGMNYMDRVKAQYAADNRANGLAVQQLMVDAVTITLNSELGFGAVRVKRFLEALNQNLDEMAELILDDTPDAIYSREKIDGKLREIVGEENFTPWEGRYIAQISPKRNRAERRRK